MEDNNNPNMEAAEATEERKPNLWRLVMLNPAAAMKYIIRFQPEEFIHRNFVFAGLAMVFATRIPDWLATTSNPIGVMIQVLFMGPVLGIFVGYIFTAAAKNIGKWMGAEADKNSLRAAISWSNVPFAFAYLVFLGLFFVVFALRPSPLKKFVLFDGVLGWIPVVVFVLMFCYALWVRWKCMSHVLNVSIGKTILIWLLSFLITFGPLLILGISFVSIYIRSIEWVFKQ